MVMAYGYVSGVWYGYAYGLGLWVWLIAMASGLWPRC